MLAGGLAGSWWFSLPPRVRVGVRVQGRWGFWCLDDSTLETIALGFWKVAWWVGEFPFFRHWLIECRNWGGAHNSSIEFVIVNRCRVRAFLGVIEIKDRCPCRGRFG